MRFGTPQTAGRPCNGCTEPIRHVGCHDGTCPLEAEWLAKTKPKQDAIIAAKTKELEVDSFRMKQVRKAKKRQNRK